MNTDDIQVDVVGMLGLPETLHGAILSAKNKSAEIIRKVEDAGYTEDQRDLIGRAMAILSGKTHGFMEALGIAADRHEIIAAARAVEACALVQMEAYNYLASVDAKAGTDLAQHIKLDALQDNVDKTREIRERLEAKLKLAEELAGKASS